MKKSEIYMWIGICILLPFVVTMIICFPTSLLYERLPFIMENFTTSNDWIGFFGSFMGSVLGGVITLYALIKNIEASNENLEQSLTENKKMQNRNERINFCNDIANLIANYCSESRNSRSSYKWMEDCSRNKMDADKKFIDSKFKTKAHLKGKNESEVENIEKELIQIRYNKANYDYDKALDKMDNNEISLYFELCIKLKNIKLAELLLKNIEKVRNLRVLNVSEEDYKIIEESDKCFEESINNLLKEATNFIDKYVNEKL